MTYFYVLDTKKYVYLVSRILLVDNTDSNLVDRADMLSDPALVHLEGVLSPALN